MTVNLRAPMVFNGVRPGPPHGTPVRLFERRPSAPAVLLRLGGALVIGAEARERLADVRDDLARVLTRRAG